MLLTYFVSHYSDTVVFGQWKDKFYYSGVISSYNERTSRYNVLFDDGSKRQIPHNEMVPLTLLHIGAEVLAQQSEDDDSGTVVQQNNPG